MLAYRYCKHYLVEKDDENYIIHMECLKNKHPLVNSVDCPWFENDLSDEEYFKLLENYHMLGDSETKKLLNNILLKKKYYT